MPRTLTGARFDQSATLLHQGQQLPPEAGIDLSKYGQWVNSQDPLTGEIVRIWTPYDDPTPDVNTPDNITIAPIKCLARGIVDGGIRVAGTTEWFGADYRNIDFVKMWVPPKTIITKRDRITNITDKSGHIQWLDEEFESNPDRATVFNVNGVTPLFNGFNRLVEKFVLLERAEI